MKRLIILIVSVPSRQDYWTALKSRYQTETRSSGGSEEHVSMSETATDERKGI